MIIGEDEEKEKLCWDTETKWGTTSNVQEKYISHVKLNDRELFAMPMSFVCEYKVVCMSFYWNYW